MFTRTHRKKFVDGRSPLSDAEFAVKSSVRPELHRIVAAAREALARVCHIPATMIYPEDLPESLQKLTFDGWDDAAVVIELESVLSIPIERELPRFVGGRFFWRHSPGASSVGDWCRRVAEDLQSIQTYAA
jgi:hypothetical protein